MFIFVVRVFAYRYHKENTNEYFELGYRMGKKYLELLWFWKLKTQYWNIFFSSWVVYWIEWAIKIELWVVIGTHKRACCKSNDNFREYRLYLQFFSLGTRKWVQIESMPENQKIFGLSKGCQSRLTLTSLWLVRKIVSWPLKHEIHAISLLNYTQNNFTEENMWNKREIWIFSEKANSI